MTTFSELSDSMAAAVQAAGPGVVRVEARRRLPATGLVWAEGIVVTASHAVDDEANIHVGAEGESIPASLVGRDPSTDLAVLRLQSSLGQPLPLAPEAALRPGHLVLALGRPGRSLRASLGLLGHVGGPWRTLGGTPVEHFLEPDLVMYPGFSGGPLLSAAGQVLGINTTGLRRSGVITLPAAAVQAVAAALIEHGHMRRAYLGVGSQPVRLPQGIAAEVGQETGLLINSVEPGSPAEKGGLLLGDTLIALDDQPLRHMDDLFLFLSGDRVGQNVRARVVRGGAVQSLSLTLGDRP